MSEQAFLGLFLLRMVVFFAVGTVMVRAGEHINSDENKLILAMIVAFVAEAALMAETIHFVIQGIQ